MPRSPWPWIAVLWLGLLPGCQGTPAARWREAQRLWEERELRPAFLAYRSLDPGTPEGSEAHRRLAAADQHYRRAITLLGGGKDHARDEVDAGMALGPMDPLLYLPWARAFRDHGQQLRAAASYRAYLTLAADRAPAADVQAARVELTALDPEADTFPVLASAGPARAARRPLLPWLAAAGLLMGGAAVLTLLLLRRRSTVRLLARERPELHPALVYLIGGLRHELLKHRIGAIADAVAALAESRLSPAQRHFLFGRLYGGEPLLRAWHGHLRGLRRALGLRLDLQYTDRLFYEADRELRRIASLHGGLSRGDQRAAAALLRAQRTLLGFDRALQGLCAGLSRTRVDRDLLRLAVSAVRDEYAVAQVALDELRVDDVTEEAGAPVEIDIYRVDLLLVVKNLVRNAILAADRAPAPRRVAVDGAVELLPTGEEIVRLRVRDTSPARPPEEALRGGPAEAGRGLSLVGAALSLYHGGLDIQPGGDGFHKAVTVWFFRSQQEVA